MEALYEPINTNRSLMAPLNVVIYLLRRLLLAVTVVCLGKFPWLQMMLLSISSFAMIAYMVGVRPFTEKWFYFFEILNETTILFISYILIPLTWTEDESLHSKSGYFLTFLVLSTMILNIINCLISFVMEIYAILKTVYRKVKAWCLTKCGLKKEKDVL